MAIPRVLAACCFCRRWCKKGRWRIVDCWLVVGGGVGAGDQGFARAHCSRTALRVPRGIVTALQRVKRRHAREPRAVALSGGGSPNSRRISCSSCPGPDATRTCRVTPGCRGPADSSGPCTHGTPGTPAAPSVVKTSQVRPSLCRGETTGRPFGWYTNHAQMATDPSSGWYSKQSPAWNGLRTGRRRVAR